MEITGRGGGPVKVGMGLRPEGKDVSKRSWVELRVQIEVGTGLIVDQREVGSCCCDLMVMPAMMMLLMYSRQVDEEMELSRIKITIKVSAS